MISDSDKMLWEIAVAAGWGPMVAAINVVRHIRYIGNLKDDFVCACWYYRQLVGHANEEKKSSELWVPRIWLPTITTLYSILSSDELERIIAQLKYEDGGPSRTKR